MRKLVVLGMVVIMLGSCSQGADSNVDELEARIAELEAAASSTTVTTTTQPTTTTTQPTTTTLETLSEAAELWCYQNPYLFARGAVVLGAVGDSLQNLLDTGGKTYFWVVDGYDIFRGKQKFDTLPTDWYEYPGTHRWLQEQVELARSTRIDEAEYVHACNVAFELR